MTPQISKSAVLKRTVENRILIIRGQNVILDRDLAELYGVATKVFNQAVKRNKDRFPKDFMFQLTAIEKEEVVTNCDHLKGLRFSPNLPLVFTEHGAIMAANILNSERAARMSIYVIRAFIKLREVFNLNQILQGRLTEIERILLDHDTALRDLYEKIKSLLVPPRKIDAIGFEIHSPRPGKIG
jgi:hypothetical protein